MVPDPHTIIERLARIRQRLGALGLAHPLGQDGFDFGPLDLIMASPSSDLLMQCTNLRPKDCNSEIRVKKRIPEWIRMAAGNPERHQPGSGFR